MTKTLAALAAFAVLAFGATTAAPSTQAKPVRPTSSWGCPPSPC